MLSHIQIKVVLIYTVREDNSILEIVIYTIDYTSLAITLSKAIRIIPHDIVALLIKHLGNMTVSAQMGALSVKDQDYSLGFVRLVYSLARPLVTV